MNQTKDIDTDISRLKAAKPEPRLTPLARAILSALGMGVAVAPAVVHAQADPAGSGGARDVVEQGEQLEEIVVRGFRYGGDVEVASKSTLSIRDTPQAISVITHDSLEARQVTGLGQGLEVASGVTQSSEPGPFAGRSGLGFVTYQIRGVHLPNYYGVREDGFLVPQITGTRDLAPFERIEVVKGPNSALFGQGSAGGFINLVRKKPLPEFQASFKADVGSYDYYRVEGDVTGPLFGSDRARGRLIAAYEDAGSFIDFAESERIVLAPSLDYDLTDNTALTLHGTYQDDRFVPHPGMPLLRIDGGDGGFVAAELSRSEYWGAPNRDLDNNTRQLASGGLKLEHRLGDKWLVDLRFSGVAAEQDLRQSHYAYSYYFNDGNVNLANATFDNEIDIWSTEVRLNGVVELLGRSTTLTFGAEANEVDYNRSSTSGYSGDINIYEQSFSDAAEFESNYYDYPFTSNSTFKEKGVFGQVYFRATERLAVLLGGRFSQTDVLYQDLFFGAATLRDTTHDTFTGRAGLTYEVSTNVAVYGLYGESFLPVVFGVGRDGPLEPETGDIIEAGIKTEWLDGKLGINAALFRLERDNVPIADPENAPFEFFQISAGVQRADGFELEINGELLPGWNLSFGGTISDSEFIEEADPNFGNAPRDAADWQFGFYSSYEMQEGPARGLGFNAGMFAIADRPLSEAFAGTVEGYERLDLGVSYNALENVKFAVQVRNVLDERYVEVLERPGAYNHFGSPRAVLFTARYKMN